MNTINANTRSRLIVVTLLAILCGFLLQGCTEETLTFEDFKRLAHWDLSSAQYVRLSATGVYRNWPDQMGKEPLLVGNAWLIQEEKDAESEFLVNGFERILVADKFKPKVSLSEPLDVMQLWLEYPKSSRGEREGNWVAADLDIDLTNLLHFLRGEKPKSELGYLKQLSLTEKGRLLLFAVNVAKSGKRGQP